MKQAFCEKKIIYCLFLLLISCAEFNDPNCTFKYRSFDGTERTVKGCMSNSIEYGHWTHLDSVGNVLEEGNYDSGIFVGLWKYNLPDNKSLSIEWLKYENRKLNFSTNVPSDLSKIEEGDFFVKFQKPDSSDGITLVIIIHDTSAVSFPINQFHLQGEKELSEKGWKFERQPFELKSEGKTFYSNFYKLFGPTQNRFIWSIDESLEGGKVLQVFTNYDPANDVLGRITFTGVSSNLFIDGKRLLYPYKQPD